MSDWSQFLTWARRLADEVDLDAEERNYKLAMAARLRVATERAGRGDADWLASLRKALQGSNLLPWQFVDSLLKAAEREPSRLRDAIVGLVDSSDPVAHLDCNAREPCRPRLRTLDEHGRADLPALSARTGGGAGGSGGCRG